MSPSKIFTPGNKKLLGRGFMAQAMCEDYSESKEINHRFSELNVMKKLKSIAIATLIIILKSCTRHTSGLHLHLLACYYVYYEFECRPILKFLSRLIHFIIGEINLIF